MTPQAFKHGEFHLSMIIVSLPVQARALTRNGGLATFSRKDDAVEP